ncbi:ricin-type beta-trefoil lectin domain protein [Dactylosporangium sp. NPDC050688]|uniref:ricin-type beta-trefoil lectin domain protein n=1 Tax=Dactylosporangium sp. NPDC050688 TaxID=3157217 RepID=UPI00340FEAC0
MVNAHQVEDVERPRHRQGRLRPGWWHGRGTALVAAGVVLAAGVALAVSTDDAPPGGGTPQTVAVENQVSWSDEFNGPAGTSPDAAKWVFAIGGGGWGNQELQYYTDSPSNASMDGKGNLVITARKENPAGYDCWNGKCAYTSARIFTKKLFEQRYGRFEMRTKFPVGGKGIWPSMFMLGNNIDEVDWPESGEIDVVEYVGSKPGQALGTIHGPGYNGGGGVGAAYDLPNGAVFGDDFHLFAVDWTADSITWSVDNVVYSRKTAADLRGNRWVFDHPFYILLNFAVGGQLPGSPDGGTPFPQMMVVDYVRAYATPGARDADPDPTTEPSETTAASPGPSASASPGKSTAAPTSAAATPGKGGPATAAPGGNGVIVNVASQKCLDIPRSNPVDGQYVQIWQCYPMAGQKWTFESDGTLRSMGLCLDVAHNNTANGTRIQTVRCNTSPATQFKLTASGELVNPPSGKCVDVKGNSTQDGAQLQLWDCNGSASQKWRR